VQSTDPRTHENFAQTTHAVLSYIDDISLTVASISLKKNIRILEREVAKLYELGAKNAIQFDLAKAELMHFSMGKQTKTSNLKAQIITWGNYTAQRGGQMVRNLV
jgi:hypothetical protein